MHATTEDTDIGSISFGAKDLFVRGHGSASPREDSVLDLEELLERKGPGGHGDI